MIPHSAVGARLVRALLVSVALLGSGSAFAAAEPIKHGEVASLTGKEAAFGQQAHRGIQMAIDEVNARGGVLGRPLTLVSEDNQSKPGDSATIEFYLTNTSFSIWDVSTHSFQLVSGPFQIMVGSSSQNILLQTSVNIPLS